MRDFDHVVDWWETNAIVGTRIYNKVKGVEATVLAIKKCSIATPMGSSSYNLCIGCQSRGQVMIVQLPSGREGTWCRSLWEGGT
jgi:hypothetical protein